jgi:predicted SnoaL-like aldol condensation-catalyzing enzyme
VVKDPSSVVFVSNNEQKVERGQRRKEIMPMKSFLSLASLCVTLLVATGVKAQGAPNSNAQVESNKKTAIAFYNALSQGDVATLQALGRPDYIQHNPAYETGLQGLIKRIQSRPPRAADAPPIPPLQFVRVIAEGDFVMTLRKMSPPAGTSAAPGAERANVDIFRVQDGKVAEHWDYQETFPRGTEDLNHNGRF